MELKSFVWENTELTFARQLLSPALSDHFGWGNGYVVLPVDHPLHGIDRDKMPPDLDVFGGVTFSRLIDGAQLSFLPHHLDEHDLGKWLIGFDTANGRFSEWPREAVEKETKAFENQLRYYGCLTPN